VPGCRQLLASRRRRAPPQDEERCPGCRAANMTKRRVSARTQGPARNQTAATRLSRPRRPKLGHLPSAGQGQERRARRWQAPFELDSPDVSPMSVILPAVDVFRGPNSTSKVRFTGMPLTYLGFPKWNHCRPTSSASQSGVPAATQGPEVVPGLVELEVAVPRLTPALR
jgi:hypothetical protein